MALKDKISLYDRNGNLGETGRPVSETQAGDFQQNNFKDTEDHLEELLNKRIQSNTTGETYPSHNYFRPPSKDLDLEAIDGGNGYFHGTANPQVYQGLQVNGTDLLRDLLVNEYTYGNPASTVPKPNPTAPGPQIDLDGLDPVGYTSNQSLLDDNARF